VCKIVRKEIISDFEKFRLQYSVLAPFRNRNVYFNLHKIWLL